MSEIPCPACAQSFVQVDGYGEGYCPHCDSQIRVDVASYLNHTTTLKPMSDDTTTTDSTDSRDTEAIVTQLLDDDPEGVYDALRAYTLRWATQDSDHPLAKWAYMSQAHTEAMDRIRQSE